ncbi:MAG: hypothetical protein J5641_06650, partial [Bacteroidales bacterium]|nr:hypothetical protein [Bacteroidales bacterium]
KLGKILIIPSMLALLVVGCQKESNRIRILAEGMTRGGKVFVTPTNINNATWVNGEIINLNGTNCTIYSRSDGFYIDVDTRPTGDFCAVYPGGSFGGNDVTVTNSNASGATITLNRLVVNFHDGGHDIAFPMAAKAAGGNLLRFSHLTGGLQLTLQAATACNVATVRVITYGTGAATPVVINEVPYTVSWAGQGPTVPTGDVGGIEGDFDVKYASEMVFDMKTSGTVGVSVGTDPVTFCVPVTVNGIRRLTVKGYASDGTELFSKTTELSNTDIARNTMYNVPTIQIN